MLWSDRLKHWRVGRVTGSVLEVGSVGLALAFVSVGNGLLSLAAPFVFGALILVFAFQGGVLSALLSGKIGQLLGELSYSIYMTALLVSIPFNRIPVAVAERMGMDITRPHPVRLMPTLTSALARRWSTTCTRSSICWPWSDSRGSHGDSSRRRAGPGSMPGPNSGR